MKFKLANIKNHKIIEVALEDIILDITKYPDYTLPKEIEPYIPESWKQAWSLGWRGYIDYGIAQTILSNKWKGKYGNV